MVINSVKCQHVNHKWKYVGNKTKKKVKKKSNTSKTNTLLKCQTRSKVPIEKVLHILDTLHFPACHQTKHLLDFTNRPEWMYHVDPISLNAINITHMPFIASSDVLSWKHNDDDLTLDSTPVDIQIVQLLCIDTSKFSSDELATIDNLPQAVPILDEDTPVVNEPILIIVKAIPAHDRNEVRGQFNNGADATVTNLLVYLHEYKLYDRKFKCPIVRSNDFYPLGEGKLCVPAAVPDGYLAVRCFYSPHLSSTLISPRDILKTATCWNKDFSGQDMRYFYFADGNPNFGNSILTCHHCLHSSQNIVVEGVIIAGNSYTHPLIAPDLPLNHPGPNSYNSKEYAMKNDPDFVQAVNNATIEAANAYQDHQLNLLDKVLVSESSCLKMHPFKKLIIKPSQFGKYVLILNKFFGTND